MQVLGAILAGGQSRRFGSDKAAALLAGKPLIEHVAETLAPQVDDILICGRSLAGYTGVADRPEPGLGPLGGLNAALHHADALGFDAVFTIGCDMPRFPSDLVRQLRPFLPAVVEGVPLVGLWPVTLTAVLDSHLAAGNDRSMRGWTKLVRAMVVPLAIDLPNLNSKADLEMLERVHLAKGEGGTSR